MTAYPKRSFHAGNAPGKGSAVAAYTPRATARATTLAATIPSSVRPTSGSTGFSPVGSGEHHVAVERCVHRIDRAGKTGLRDHREPLGLRPGQLGIGHDDRKRGVFHRCRVGSALYAHCQHVRQERRRQSASAIFAADCNGAAQNHGPSPTVTLPTALTTASAAMRRRSPSSPMPSQVPPLNSP